MSLSQAIQTYSLPGDNALRSSASLPQLVAAPDKDARLDLLPDTPKQPRTLGYLAKQFMTTQTQSDTGLEGLPHREFLDLARAKQAFYHATGEHLPSPAGTYTLSEGWWSSLLNKSFLTHPQGKDFLLFLSQLSKDGVVAEIGPGAQLGDHQRLFRQALGAKLYLS